MKKLSLFSLAIESENSVRSLKSNLRKKEYTELKRAFYNVSQEGFLDFFTKKKKEEEVKEKTAQENADQLKAFLEGQVAPLSLKDHFSTMGSFDTAINALHELEKLTQCAEKYIDQAIGVYPQIEHASKDYLDDQVKVVKNISAIVSKMKPSGSFFSDLKPHATNDKVWFTKGDFWFVGGLSSKKFEVKDNSAADCLMSCWNVVSCAINIGINNLSFKKSETALEVNEQQVKEIINLLISGFEKIKHLKGNKEDELVKKLQSHAIAFEKLSDVVRDQDDEDGGTALYGMAEEYWQGNFTWLLFLIETHYASMLKSVVSATHR